MRTRRLCTITLLVLALHAIAWQLAHGGLPAFAPARAGVRTFAVVSVPQGGEVPGRIDGAPRAAMGTPERAVAAAPAPAARSGGRVTRARRVPAGDGGAAPAAPTPARAPPWPVYATQAPPSIALRYRLLQSATGPASAPLGGRATLEWTNADGAFGLRLATAVDGRPPRAWESTGRFDAAGLAPGRLVERERGRDRRSVTFDRDDARVRFSSAPGVLPVAPGAQDRWSWMAQLAAIAEADARRGGAPERRGTTAGPWTLQVAGLRGDLERWTFHVLPTGPPPPLPGNELSAMGDRAPGLLHVLRASERPYDLRIEAWLSPALHHFPAALRMSTPPGPWSLTLVQSGT